MQAFLSVKDAGGVQKWPLRNSGLWMLQFLSQFKKKYLTKVFYEKVEKKIYFVIFDPKKS